MFQDEARYKIDHFIKVKDLHLKENKVARVYSEQRASLVDRILAMGKKFNQRTKTLHIAIEIMDRFFLDKRAQSMSGYQSMSSRLITIVMTTCFLIASKYDEIDDQLVFINDAQKYFQRIGQTNNPTYTDIVETERMLMNFFGWDLGFVMPIHFVEMFLANGILFETEHNSNITKNKATAKKLADKCYEVLNDMIKQNTCFKNQGFSGNQVASMIIYTARQEVLNLSRARYIWPKELQLISRQTEKEVRKLASIYKKNSKKYRHEPFSDDLIANEQTSYSNKVTLIVDLTKQRSSAMQSYNDPALVSPKAKQLKEQFSSEKRQTAEKIPVAQITMPGMSKKLINSNTKNTLSSSKNTLISSAIKKQLDNAKNMPFRTKKTSSNYPRVGNSKCILSNPTEKNEENDQNKVIRHFISAQKNDDGKVRLFAERRVSQNNALNNDNSL